MKFRKTTSIIDRQRSLKAFFDDIKRYPMLTQQQEVAVAKAGDKHTLVTSNLKFVVRAAYSCNYMGDLMDLIQVAGYGMVLAAEAYDPAKTNGGRFISYASSYIFREIQRYNVKENTTYKSKDFYLSMKIATVDSVYYAENGDHASIGHIAEELGVSEEKVRNVLAGNLEKVSMDAPMEEEGSYTLSDRCWGDMDADVRVCEQEKKAVLKKALEKVLTPSERQLVCLHYGLESGNMMKIREVAKIMNCTVQWCNQLKRNAKVKLRKCGFLQEALSKK